MARWGLPDGVQVVRAAGHWPTHRLLETLVVSAVTEARDTVSGSIFSCLAGCQDQDVLLRPELVARKPSTTRPWPEAPLQPVHLGVALDRCASKRCHVVAEQHLVPQEPRLPGPAPAGCSEGVRERCPELSGARGVGVREAKRTLGAFKIRIWA